jgi:hypothetical protein
MKQAASTRRVGKPSPAMVVAIIALICALSGSAWAAIGKNSVGSRQLKASAVTTGKLANNAVTGPKVADGSLTGADINLAALGTVPSAASAEAAANANTVGGHAASCPPGTTLIRGLCFDSTSSGPAPSLQAAAEACAARGGYLPTPMELYSTRGVLNLGSGIGADHQYTDTIYSNTSGGNYRTIVIDGTGALTEQAPSSASRYICVYPLVR